MDAYEKMRQESAWRLKQAYFEMAWGIVKLVWMGWVTWRLLK